MNENENKPVVIEGRIIKRVRRRMDRLKLPPGITTLQAAVNFVLACGLDTMDRADEQKKRLHQGWLPEVQDDLGTDDLPVKEQEQPVSVVD